MVHGHASSGSLPADSDSRPEGPAAAGNAPYALGRGGGSDSAGEEGRPQHAGAGGEGVQSGNRALYVGNLAASVDEQALTMQFSVYGQVLQTQVSQQDLITPVTSVRMIPGTAHARGVCERAQQLSTR
jgi:hypothetical protein